MKQMSREVGRIAIFTHGFVARMNTRVYVRTRASVHTFAKPEPAPLVQLAVTHARERIYMRAVYAGTFCMQPTRQA